MFDLMRMIKESKNEMPRPIPATVATVATAATAATTQRSQRFSFCDTLATSCDKGHKADQEREFVAVCRNLSQAIKQPESQRIRRESPLSQMSQPPLLNFNFLKETPFTKAMILEGLRRWQEPFDQNDLDEIAAGKLTIEQAREYLFIWARQNYERYKTLKVLINASHATASPT